MNQFWGRSPSPREPSFACPMSFAFDTLVGRGVVMRRRPAGHTAPTLANRAGAVYGFVCALAAAGEDQLWQGDLGINHESY